MKEGKITIEKLVEKMSHAVATCFQIAGRGYIREDYAADLVIVDLNRPYSVTKENILYKCNWSPFEGHRFPAAVTHTFVNGNLVYHQPDYGNVQWNESYKGERLKFVR